MNRREFVISTTALAIIGVLPKEDKVYRERVLLDYGSNEFDEHGEHPGVAGVIYNRTFESEGIKDFCVSKARLLESGDLEVEYWTVDYSEKPIRSKNLIWMGNGQYINYDKPINQKIISDWKINCYTETGTVYKVLDRHNVGLT